MTIRYIRVLALALLASAACSRNDATPRQHAGGEPDHAAPTNRVDIPQSVRDNLGITFARVERRAVARTARTPGRFELLPDARREYRTALDGKVELLVTQFDRVEKGTPLFRLESPKWQELQREIAQADASILLARASLETIGPLRAAHKLHEESLAETVRLWSERVAQLEKLRDAGGGRGDDLAQARITSSSTKADLADVMEKDADLEARNRQNAAEYDAAKSRFDILIAGAAILLGTTPADLLSRSTDAMGAPPRWRTISHVETRAAAPGVVESIGVTSGAWVEAASLVITTVQPDRIRFLAHAIQGDLMAFKEGQTAVIAPPRSRDVAIQDVMRGRLVLGLAASADERTFDLFVTPEKLASWARAGIAGYLEVTVAGAEEELAVPKSALARDGVKTVLFRRNPKDKDQVIRIEADLGVDDGRWVVLKSGVIENDEVVLDGVYQLMLATSAGAQQGGHFHADGTFHATDHK
jgi:multidrug resistance efflux pump